MPASSVKRKDHLTGDDFRTFESGGVKSQGFTLCDADGNLLTILPVSVASLPLPSGASTENTLQAIASIANSDLSKEVTLLNIKTLLESGVINVIPNADFLTEVAKGNIAGHRVLELSGFNPNVSSGAAETVWAGSGTFTPPLLPITVIIESDDLNDTGLGGVGSGAQEITLVGLDANFNEITEVVAMSGLIPATSLQSFIAVNEAYVSSVGVTGSNQGTVTGTIGLTKVFDILPGYNNTSLGFYTVPDSKTGYLYDFNVSLSNQSSTSLHAMLYMRFGENEPLRLKKHFGGHSQGGPASGNFAGTESIPSRGFLRWDADVSSNNTEVSCTTTVLLVDD